MCPLCITTALLSAGGITSGAGAIAIAASKWRTLQRWLCRSYCANTCEKSQVSLVQSTALVEPSG
jgi:hypothetical protein